MTPLRRFFLAFALSAAALGAIVAVAGPAVDAAVSRAMAFSAAAVLGGRAEGAEVRLEDRAVTVGAGCTSTHFAAIFLCALAAWPATWRRRLAAVGAAFAVLFLMDVVRVTALVRLAGTPAFDAAHVFSGAGYVGVLLVAWLGWMRWSGPRVRLPRLPLAGAAALAFVFAAGELALAQGPPPPPPLEVPLGGAAFALAGVVASAWELLRRRA
ncbi:MAG: hypothetical protein HYY17_15030 [Planctomycetes bacterium]|nr:hypothetical protein [Planctomycetota bacterium]